MIHGSFLDHFAHCTSNHMPMLLWTCGSILFALPIRTIFFMHFFGRWILDQFCVPLCAFVFSFWGEVKFLDFLFWMNWWISSLLCTCMLCWIFFF